MPRRDAYHNAVKNALVKDGWTITHDPFILDVDDLQLQADLGAEKPIAAEKGLQKIVVEIKVFGGVSLITELQKALGQYSVYRSLLIRMPADAERQLYLAIPQTIYETFFQRDIIQGILADYAVNLMVFTPDAEEVIEWIR